MGDKVGIPARNEMEMEGGESVEMANLLATVRTNTHRLKNGAVVVEERFSDIDARLKGLDDRIARERDLGVETRVLMGERELRMRDLVKQVSALAHAFADGLDELVREW